MTAARTYRAHRGGQGAAGADEDDQPPGAGDGGVEQVRCSIIQALVVSGMTTAEYSEPWLLWIVVA